MYILMKYMLKNIVEKKFRTLIVVISIMVSSALFFSSIEISDAMVKISTDRLRQYVGNSDIVIRAKDTSPGPFFETADARSYSNQTEYVIEALEGIGQFERKSETVTLNLLGMNSGDMERMNPITLTESASWSGFTGNKLVISSRTAEQYDLKKGDSVELDVAGTKTSFEIFGIAKASGMFREDGGMMYGWMPKQPLSDAMKAADKVNAIFMKAKEGTNVSNLIDDLSDDYKDYLVAQSITDEEIKSQVGPIANTFLLMTVIVTLLSVFIINSSVKVIVFERIPIIGTFRSVGATKRTTSFLLLAESAMYGALGGIFGCLLGIGVLYLMTMVLNSGAGASPEINATRLVMTFLMALILPVLSSLGPVLKTSRTQLKDIVLNKIDDDNGRKKNNVIGFIIGVVALVAAAVIPPNMSFDLAVPLGIGCLVLIMVGIVLITPFLLNAFGWILIKGFGWLIGNEGFFAVKNIRDNKNTLNNVSLLSIAVSTLLMINVVGYGVVVELTNFYSTTPQFDIMARADRMDQAFVDKAEKIEGVESIYAAYVAGNVTVKGEQGAIGQVEGASGPEFLEHWSYQRMSKDRDALIDELQEGRNILLTNILRDKFGVQEGDTLTLELATGEKAYKVIGFIDTSRNNGNYAVVSANNLKQDADKKFYSSLTIMTKDGADPELVAKDFQKEFSAEHPWSRTMQSIEEVDRQNSDQQFLILKGFSVLALLISILSIVNNLVINFIQRKRSLAMYRSVGMSKGQIIKMIMVESVVGGVLGAIAGVIGGVLLIELVPYVIQALGLRVIIHYTADVFIYTVSAGILVTIIASLAPAIKSSKLNIIEAIKMD